MITASLIELSIRSISDRSDCEGVSVRTEDTFNINFKRCWDCCHVWEMWENEICDVDSSCAVWFWVILFTIWFLSLSNCYFPETLECRLKYMWRYVCENMFNFVKVYARFFAKYVRVSLFLDTVYIQHRVYIALQKSNRKGPVTRVTWKSLQFSAWKCLTVVVLESKRPLSHHRNPTSFIVNKKLWVWDSQYVVILYPLPTAQLSRACVLWTNKSWST